MTTHPIDLTATSPTAANTNSNVTAAAANSLNGNDFMTLLVAQLKNQDPTQPMDPTQFVSQLVQFNSLEQLIGIKSDLDSSTAATAAAATSGSGASPSSTNATTPSGSGSSTSTSNPSGATNTSSSTSNA